MAAANSISIKKYRDLIKGKGKFRSNKYNVSTKDERTWYGLFRGRYQSILFDSKKEMNRFNELLFLLKENIISELQIKEKFYISDKKYYESDFSYFNFDTHKWTAEDVKSRGTITPLFKLKWDLIKEKYNNIDFIIVY